MLIWPSVLISPSNSLVELFTKPNVESVAIEISCTLPKSSQLNIAGVELGVLVKTHTCLLNVFITLVPLNISLRFLTPVSVIAYWVNSSWVGFKPKS